MPSSGTSTPTGNVTFFVDDAAQPPVPLSVVGGQDVAIFSNSTLSAGTHYDQRDLHRRQHFAPSSMTATPAVTVKRGSGGNGERHCSGHRLHRLADGGQATVTGAGGVAGSSLEGVSPTLTYYAGTIATGTPLDGPPTVAGTYTVLAAFPGSADFTPASATATFTIAQATPMVTWANSADVTYGTPLGPLQLDAIASVPGTFVYAPAAGTFLKAGPAQVLWVTFTPADTADYSSVTATATINVQKAKPTLTWANPADVTYGTPLGPLQLDATASVPGTFAYAPAAGTILEAGPAQALSVTFTPADTADYAPVTATANINVLKATPNVTWANPAGITYGTALSATQLDATASVPGTFAYAPAAGTILKVGPAQVLSVDLHADRYRRLCPGHSHRERSTF